MGEGDREAFSDASMKPMARACAGSASMETVSRRAP
jgi:hypothetical protein